MGCNRARRRGRGSSCAPRPRSRGVGARPRGGAGPPGPRLLRDRPGAPRGRPRTCPREPGSRFAGIFSAAAAGLYLGPRRPLTFAAPPRGPGPGPRLRRAVWDVRYVRAAPSPVSAESLALFSVWMSSPRLFLSPFIFQLPPTKNFLGAMAGRSGSRTAPEDTRRSAATARAATGAPFIARRRPRPRPRAQPRPAHSPAPCPTRAPPARRGAHRSQGGYFHFYFVPRVFWHV